MFNKNVKLFGNILSPFMKELKELRENKDTINYTLIDSKVDTPTLKVEIDDKELFLHSKYNPIQEAERIVKNIDSTVTEKEHIIFFGVGLGYHIEELIKKYPNKQITIIEPNQEIFLRFLESRSLQKFPLQNLNTLYIESQEITLDHFLNSLSVQLKGDAFVYVLPAYERIFKEAVVHFYQTYQEALKATKSNVIATQAFGKRWVINSLMNVPKTIATQNIKEKSQYFKGKPIIIASAGPSLYDDLEHLKYIKEKGLAYIFAVGSANKAFMAHDIVPDAVLTYDPQPHNVNVFKELITSGRTDIPMIYGTSVGFETTEVYPGPMFHFVNSAETVTNYYLGKEETFDVHDSTTIALIAIQVAEQLGAGQIILAGQNLAFKAERYYADGIEHGEWKGEVREDREGKNVVTTKDVYGNTIETNESLINMRRDVEDYLTARPELSVINTTKGGADIKGAPFESIEKVIENNLTSEVVENDWYDSEEKTASEQTVKQVQKMERSIDRIYESLDACRTILQKLDSLKRTNKVQQINKLFTDFDKQFDRLMNNDFYKCFIASVLQNEFEQLNKTIRNTYTEQNQLAKIDTITSVYMFYLGQVQEIFREIVIHAKEKVHSGILGEMASLQMYKHNDGVFHFEGNWERETVSFHDLSRGETERKLSRTISTMSEGKGAKISFRFEGTTLQLFTQKHADFSNDVKVMIDGIEKTVRTKDRKIKDGLAPKLGQKVFEVKALRNEIHEVSIELLSDEAFHFEGVAINEGGRVYHVEEVTVIEELEIGKRIRCHYEATIYKVGTFSRLGEASRAFIPVEATPQPNGDFYFIMVDDVDGEKKLIADRNVQNYISFNSLVDGLERSILEGDPKSVIRLLKLSENVERIDEWLEYMQRDHTVGNNELVWNHVRNADESRGLYSIVSYINGESGVYSKYYHAEKNMSGIHNFVRVSAIDNNRLWGFRPMIIC